MSRSVRRYTELLVTGFIGALVAVSAPALAHGVRHALFAHNAHKVDGIHATKYTSTASNRRNNLVAASDSGYLPNNVILKAVDSDQLDGQDSGTFVTDAELTALQSQIDALTTEVNSLKQKLSAVTYSDANKLLTITGANVQVVDGSGGTDGTVNGLGNLIVGYNEASSDTRTGSHNLVVGPLHSYSSYGGIVGGYDNGISNIHASVTGGFSNTASGQYSSISGGQTRSVNSIYEWRAGDLYNDPDG